MQHQTPDPGPTRSDTGLERFDRPPLRPRLIPARNPPRKDEREEAAERLEAVFRRAPAAISVMEGSDHVVVVANPSFQRLVGERSLIGRTAREALPELADQGIFELLDRVLETAEPFVGKEMALQLDRDGDGALEGGLFDFVLEPLEHRDGQVFGVMCHATEVTAAVRVREELAAAREVAERANRAKTDFLAAMSHDLRTPLTAIGGYASLVAEGVYGPVTPGQSDAMARIGRANAHLLALIDDVLRFAQIEAGGVALRLEPIPVNEVLHDLRELIEPQVAAKGLSYECEPVPSDLMVRADRERLIQVLLNLLSNALKFTDVGTLEVACEATDGEVRISVRDSGRGIPRELIDKIFDPFFQGDHGDREGDGVGLGLTTSMSLTRAMHGSLSVDSEVGQGTVFTLILPRA